MSAHYSYDRARTAKMGTTMSYNEALNDVQSTFTAMVASLVYDYVTTLHRRIRNRAPWKDMSGFLNWDYGTPRGSSGVYQVRVWEKDGGIYPDDIDPVLNITLTFKSKIDVEVKAGSKALLNKSFGPEYSASSVSLKIGEAWEKLLTGSVDYGD